MRRLSVIAQRQFDRLTSADRARCVLQSFSHHSLQIGYWWKTPPEARLSASDPRPWPNDQHRPTTRLALWPPAARREGARDGQPSGAKRMKPPGRPLGLPRDADRVHLQQSRTGPPTTWHRAVVPGSVWPHWTKRKVTSGASGWRVAILPSRRDENSCACCETG